MLLATQVQAIIYHLFIGWIYGLTFSFISYFSYYLKYNLTKFILETIFHIIFVLSAFYGLYQINGSVTNLYLILCFVFGMFVYFKWYYCIFLNFFHYVKKWLKPIKLAKNRISVIIKVTGSHFVRRKKSYDKEETNKKEYEIWHSG